MMTYSLKVDESTGFQESSLEGAREEVRQNLRRVAAALAMEGLPRPALDGKILRPLTAFLTVPPSRRAELDERFWYGALAVEMVHEASLLHDDILDEAPQRRGKPTMVAEAGVGPALVAGDHLLTAAYRAAAATQSPEFLAVFIRSVERTVAGEIAQEQSQGRLLEESEYRQIITEKSGELFRSSLTLAPALLGIGGAEKAGELGARLGCLYQMIDDFLDYCSHAERGKKPLQDYRQEKWTWPLGLIGASNFHEEESTVLSRLFESPTEGAMAPMVQGAEALREEVEAILEDLSGQGLETEHLGKLLRDWVRLVEKATAREVSLRSGSPVASPELRGRLQTAAAFLKSPADRLAYFGRHAKSFRFASRLFPREQLERVADVYAFCRFTDDLVDEAQGEDVATLDALLTEWCALARIAYQGQDSGVSLLNDVMGEMARSRVPFHYVEDLVKGVGMDLSPRRYRTRAELRVYSYRVASVVGGWLTELFGIRDPWVLDRAFALGHAMQLTNILRDVGEDLRQGRLYLPEESMRAHGVTREMLNAKASGSRLAFPGYVTLLESLMKEAEADYDRAFEAIPALPRFFQGPVAVAASVYRGIHREIRRNRFDNLSRRASTSFPRKIRLGLEGLWELRRASASFQETVETAPGPAGITGGEGQEAAA